MKKSQLPLYSPKRLKPRSTAWRTTWLVMLVVVFTMIMSILFFWRSLYLPELKQHAFYLSNEIILYKDAQNVLEKPASKVQPDYPLPAQLIPDSLDADQLDLSNANPKEQLKWLESHLSFNIISDPAELPRVQEKYFVELFTDEFETMLSQSLGEQVRVYFKFKPTPTLWVRVPSIQHRQDDGKLAPAWLRQPVSFYANYSPSMILAWLLGTPILAMMAILVLIRQINRPLERLRRAARQYSKTGHTEHLQTTTGPIEIRQVNQAFNQLFNQLEQTEKERTVMLAGISHDLRTPLTRMRLTAEMLPDAFFKDGLIYDIDDMDAILEQFISFMRDGSDEPLVPTNLDTLFQEIMVQFNAVTFHYTPCNLPKIPLRTLSIKRLIINLVNNAKRYGAEPITLRAYISADLLPPDPTNDKSVAKEVKKLHILVRDEGEGIPEAQLEEVMQPFVRGEQARTTQGSGLGLAIVSRIAKLHSGKVKAKNHPDGGLEVKVVIPLR